MKEGAPRVRCPSSRVVRGASLIVRDCATVVVKAGGELNDVFPFVHKGVEDVAELADYIIPSDRVNQVISTVLPTRELGPDTNYQYIRK